MHSKRVIAANAVHLRQSRSKPVNLMLGIPVAIALIGAALYSGNAHSQGAPDKTSIGLGVAVVPKYIGSKDYTALPVPLVTFRSQRFFIRGLEAGYAYPLTQQITVGPIVSLQRGRKENDSDRLAGLGDIDTTVGLGGFISGQFGAFNTTLKVIQSSKSSYGATVGLDGSYTWKVSPQDSLSLGAGTIWGSDKYMQTHFGVSPDQAATSRANLPAYNASSGFSYVRAGVTWIHAINPSFSVMTMVGAGTLVGDTKDSPVIERSTSMYSTLGLIYSF